MCLVACAAVTRAAEAASSSPRYMVPRKGFVLLARLSALCRAMWTIRRFARSSWVKCRVPNFVLKAATDDPGGAPPISWKRYPSSQAYLQPHICRQWVSTAGSARGGHGSRQPSSQWYSRSACTTLGPPARSSRHTARSWRSALRFSRRTARAAFSSAAPDDTGRCHGGRRDGLCLHGDLLPLGVVPGVVTGARAEASRM
jgi:hypothetical protein